MTDVSDNDMFLQSHFLDSLRHGIRTDGILADVLDLADENISNFDLRCDLFSEISSDEITQMSREDDKPKKEITANRFNKLLQEKDL